MRAMATMMQTSAMPIIAANDISNDDLEVSFRQGQSELVDGGSGRRSRFTKKRGVYFMKMYYQKGQCQEDGHDVGQQLGFTRPGTP